MCCSSFEQISGKLKHKLIEQHHQPFSSNEEVAFNFLIIEEQFL